MKKFLAVLGFILLTHNSAQADVMKTDFTAAQYGHSGAITSIASLTLSLNSDGTIDGTLTTIDPTLHIVGLGLNSSKSFTTSNFSHPVVNGYGWVGSFGSFYTGFNCGRNCIGDMTFTISDTTPFTSVSDAFVGGTASYQGYLFTDNDEYAGNFTAEATDGTVPEPTSMAIFGLGLAGFAALRRRKEA